VNFHVGQKVVCVHDDDVNTAGVPEIIKGHVYTISWIGIDDCWRAAPGRWCEPGTPTVSVRLQEVPKRFIDDDLPFNAQRFRPFEATLVRRPEKVRA
jgi:hypothetical protein